MNKLRRYSAFSKGVVTKYVGLASAAGLTLSEVREADETQLQHRLAGPGKNPRTHVQPDFGHVHQELRRKGMTLALLWEEYRADHADQHTYAYSQYGENYRRFAKLLKRSMRQIHRAGEKLFIDFAGPTIPLKDGTRAHIFVAAMGASSYTFAYATELETMVDWLTATARALQFYGGMPQLIVPDNPKAMITDANRYEPRANDTVLDFARHYNTSILPARPYHPQDKAKAESAVQIVERWIMARLRHHSFANVHEVNVAIAPLLTRLNQKLFQKLPGSRASTFMAIDAPALMTLPTQTYEIAWFKTVKVHVDYHVDIERHRYSVPHALVGQVLDARMTKTMIQLLYRGERIASHPRIATIGGFSTIEDHMPTAHRTHQQWTPERFIHWGANYRSSHGRSCHPDHGREQTSRTWLPNLSRITVAGQALGQGTSGSRLYCGTSDWCLPVSACAQYPTEQP